ncbi:hypothetical protein DAI22_09g094400 [Oryza sativa Japonica Group]|uniref:Uncharacterized protein n=2 Tax=Oryza TaxID=4527 RepID=A0A0E0QR86_ORYRU|nr:hypothetical protein DAI22_09g094400 [Oryza sativa Japonica Group]
MGSRLATCVLVLLLVLSCDAHTAAAPAGVAGNLTAALVHLHEELQAQDPLGCDDTCQGCLVRGAQLCFGEYFLHPLGLAECFIEHIVVDRCFGNK